MIAREEGVIAEVDGRGRSAAAGRASNRVARQRLALVMCALLPAGLLAVCSHAAAAPGRGSTPTAGAARTARPRARLLSRDAATVLRTGRIRIRLSGPRRLRLRVVVTIPAGAAARRGVTRAQPLGPPITGRRRVRLNRRGRATLTLTLTPAGRQPVRAALASCRSLALTVDLLVRRRHVRRRDQLTAGSSCPRSGGAGVQGLNTPGGGFPAGLAGLGKGPPAIFRVGAGVADFSPPAFGKAPGDPTASCDPTGMFSGKRDFAFMEPYVDAQGSGHYDGPSQGPPPLPGDPYTDCNQNGRWDGNLLGGGSNTPRFYTMVADPVTARAMVVSNGQQTIAVEVVDQEGLFNVYQQQIRDKVAADGYPLTGIFISATHDESAPDTLGLGGVTPATSGVNDYFVNYFVAKSAAAIEQAYQALRPATIRYTEVLEPANMRQCWSSYPFVDDQHMPVLQAVGTDGRPIATLASVSQHAETLGFNGGGAKDGAFTLDQEKTWVTSDWPYFFRSALEQHYGGVAIEMAGSVGSVESPQVYPSSIPRSPQKFIDAGHPAGCRTLFQAGGQDDTGGAQHVPLGYNGETRAFGQQMAGPIIQALDSGSYYPSTSSDIWGARTNVCIPLENQGFAAFAQAGVFAHRPGFSSDCSQQFPVAPNGSTSGQSVQTQVAAFRIGDGQFISIPGEVFPFTYLRGFLGPNDMPNKQPGLPPWLIPHMHTPFRFIDGLAEDMIGYIFPQGNDVGIPSSSNTPAITGLVNGSPADRFGCAHSDDSEAASGSAADLLGQALVPLLDTHGGAPETITSGRYVLPDGTLSRDPLGGPELKCNQDNVFHPNGPAVAVELPNGSVVHPSAWMSLSGLPQTTPDRDTRGYFDQSGNRVWLEVFPDVNLP